VGEGGARVVKPKLRVWVTFGGRLKFGDGRARLLDLIDARGSLLQAAKELEMSYRRAWGYLRDLERAAGFKVLERAPGGGPRSGMRLTAAGRRFVDRYWRFRAGLDTATKRHFESAFGRRGARRPGGRRRVVARRAPRPPARPRGGR
jgi:molybdate transport system regulatory protein